MKTKNWLTATALTVLLLSLAAPLFALPTSATEDDADDDHFRIVEDQLRPLEWYRLESDIVTVLFPRNGSKPMFIWWYTNAPDQVYVVKFKGLIEWFAFDHPLLPPKPEYYHRLRNASMDLWQDRFEHMYFEPEETRWMGMGDMGMMKLMLLRQIMAQLMMQLEAWHPAFFPFDSGRWTLDNIANITTTEGRIIGVSFAFKLTDVWRPRFEFTEDNIMIRVRFYNETVEETVPGTDFRYTVNAGEMKMDLVINKWEWNFDTIRDLIQQLQRLGFAINIPEGKSRLALWVNLAAINITRLPLVTVEDQPEDIEERSTLTHVDVEDMRTDMRQGAYEKPIEIPRPMIKLGFANETKTLAGFFRFVSWAKVTDYPSEGAVNLVPVKAAYIPGGAHMRLFLNYPYFGNGTLEHDPSIGVDAPEVDTYPKYSVQAPSGSDVAPLVLGEFVLPLFTRELTLALIALVSAAAVILYVSKWKRKTPVNMVGGGEKGTTG